MVVGLGEKSCSKVGGIVYILKFLGGLHIGGGGGECPPPPNSYACANIRVGR